MARAKQTSITGVESGGPETGNTLPRMPSIESGSQFVAPHFASERRRSNAQNSQNPFVDTQLYGMQQVNAPGADVTQYAGVLACSNLTRRLLMRHNIPEASDHWLKLRVYGNMRTIP
ncbi:hypothetical protein PAAG_03371 [Paracoccidioides lutzii Pb01]|uniref:Uncharacterized protein n=1 Tax=Paracoccidioides lutzii (strain ATCC MYA-826 / Pb01) TaxID=502779 RepID=C1GWZ7_PARBA|nr:hypothetical protein PAAG_03371 [Paracoccidioides lutzii Pb01]EEH41085.2 hypothetical protein PAAG_03371 [Paracoccidioides lutzii Pb01]